MQYMGIDSDKALAAVTQDGYALQYVKDQTEAVVMAAVTQDGDALQYVLDVDLFNILNK